MQNIYKKNHKKAFSLIELSIVLLISSILMTGALSISVNAVNNAKIKETKDRINKIYIAMGQYLLVNKKLPCPAEIKKSKTNDSDYGVASAGDASCNNGANTSAYTSGNKGYGMVPVQNLGLPLDMAEDGFGNKFAYIVDKNMTSSTTWAATDSSITVVEKPAGTEVNSVANAAFFIISYGANQNGAIGADSNVQNTASTDSDEIANSLYSPFESSNPPTGNFGAKIIYSSGNSDIFDDIVFYKTRSQMGMDFNALDYFKCLSYTVADVYDTTDINWPDGYYNQIVVANTACPSGWTNGPAKPTRRCGANMVWSDIINPCQKDS